MGLGGLVDLVLHIGLALAASFLVLDLLDDLVGVLEDVHALLASLGDGVSALV